MSVFPANRTLGESSTMYPPSPLFVISSALLHVYLGSSLDFSARKHLWSHGLDYNHGTGHGIGMFLNVHEGKLHPFQGHH